MLVKKHILALFSVTLMLTGVSLSPIATATTAENNISKEFARQTLQTKINKKELENDEFTLEKVKRILKEEKQKLLEADDFVVRIVLFLAKEYSLWWDTVMKELAISEKPIQMRKDVLNTMNNLDLDNEINYYRDEADGGMIKRLVHIIDVIEKLQSLYAKISEKT